MVKYYDPSVVISKQRNMSMIIGPRGYGKTYGFKKFCITRAIEYGEKFVYMRRKKSEMDEMVDFFGALRHDKKFTSKEIIFLKRGKELFYSYSYDKEDDKQNWQHIGTLVALSLEANMKSREYDEYKNVIFDEWLPLSTNDFLRNEPRKLMSFVDTSIRDRDFRLFLIGNSSVLFNPYFEYFKFYPNPFTEFSMHETKSMMIQIISSDAWSDYRRSTPLGDLIAGTDYEGYANDNDFMDDDDGLVEERSKKSQNFMVLKLENFTVGVWFDKSTGTVYFSENYNPAITEKYAFDYDGLNGDYQSFRNLFESDSLNILKRARRNGKIRFTSKKAKAHSRTITSRISLL